MSILDVAQRVLDLSEQATSSPWSFTTDTPPGAAVADCGAMSNNARAWVAATSGTRGTSIGDAMLIANYRTSAPELAAFVRKVDEVTRDELEIAREDLADARRDGDASKADYQSGRAASIRSLRRSLGLGPVPSEKEPKL